MARAQNPNIDILESAVAQLGPLADAMVFLGGCATGLLLTDSAAPPIRVTVDVDVIVEVESIVQYHQLAAELRRHGFREDQSTDAPICRWLGRHVVLDVMPTDSRVLGFGIEWYQGALASAKAISLPSGVPIRMVTAPYFLITKLAAYDGRGRGDFATSHDIEDIIAVVDGRPGIVGEVAAAEDTLRGNLRERFSALLSNDDFLAALPGHLPGDSANQARLPLVLERLQLIAETHRGA